MKPDEFDRVLLGETEIRPSSGFASAVMAAVRREAAAPPPIPFPWKRALPGLAAGGTAVVWSVMEVFRSPVRESTSMALSLPHWPTQWMTQWMNGVVPLLDTAQMFGAGWVLLGMLLTLGGLKLTWHLAGGRV